MKAQTAERLLVLMLRFFGATGLLATIFVLIPFSWMDAIHAKLGLGSMPPGPIVQYLARSLSAFYAIVSGVMLVASFDVARYRPILIYLSLAVVMLGCALFFIDLTAGLPLAWIALEGPPTALVGLLCLWLLRKIAV